MAEDKVLQSEEELGLKSESSSGMSESSVSEIQEKRDLDDGLSSVSLDIEKCQVVFKKESDVAGFKSTVTKEAKVEAADGKQDHPDQSSSDEGKDEDLSAGKIKESEIDSSTGDKVSGIQVKLDFGDELSSGADKSHATSSDNGVDFNASLSVADTSGGKDSANHEKANLEDELFSVGQQTSSTAAVGNLDFADNGLSDESEATPVEKKVDMKDAPLVDDKVKAIQEKLDLDDKLSSDHFTSKKESVDDDDDGSKPKVGKEDNMAADENLAAAADNSSLVITETQVEAAEGDEDFPFNNSSEAQVEAAEGNQDLPGNSSLEADKSEVTSSDNGVDLNASLSIAATSEGKDSANQEKVNLEDELLSGQSGFKKESDDDDGKSTVGQQASSTAAVASLDFADNSLSDKSEATSVEKKVDMKDAPLVATSEGKDSANQEKVNLEDELLSGQFGFKKESDDDDGKSTVGQQASSTAAIGSLDFADNGLSGGHYPLFLEVDADEKEKMFTFISSLEHFTI